MAEPLKTELVDALDHIVDLADEGLNPSLTREELVDKMREVADTAEIIETDEEEPEESEGSEDLEEPEDLEE